MPHHHDKLHAAIAAELERLQPDYSLKTEKVLWEKSRTWTEAKRRKEIRELLVLLRLSRREQQMKEEMRMVSTARYFAPHQKDLYLVSPEEAAEVAADLAIRYKQTQQGNALIEEMLIKADKPELPGGHAVMRVLGRRGAELQMDLQLAIARVTGWTWEDFVEVITTEVRAPYLLEALPVPDTELARELDAKIRAGVLCPGCDKPRPVKNTHSPEERDAAAEAAYGPCCNASCPRGIGGGCYHCDGPHLWDPRGER